MAAAKLWVKEFREHGERIYGMCKAMKRGRLFLLRQEVVAAPKLAPSAHEAYRERLKVVVGQGSAYFEHFGEQLLGHGAKLWRRQAQAVQIVTQSLGVHVRVLRQKFNLHVG